MHSGDITDLQERSGSETKTQPELAPGGPVEVSVVIPCLNEARSIPICIDKAFAAFQAAGVGGEVVVADNGSDDGSPHRSPNSTAHASYM